MLQEEDEGNEVHINRLNEDQAWFNPRAKCYPLISLMLAVNRTQIDLLSLGAQGQELDVSFVILWDFSPLGHPHLNPMDINPVKFSCIFQILRTIPFNHVSIKMITIHLDREHYDPITDSKHRNFYFHSMGSYPQAITKFLRKKSYRLSNKLNGNLIYRLIEPIRPNASEIKVTTMQSNKQ